MKAHGKDWVKVLEIRQHLDLDELKPKNPALRHDNNGDVATDAQGDAIVVKVDHITKMEHKADCMEC